MIELYSDVQKRKETFQLNLMATVGREIFLNSAQRDLQDYEYSSSSLKDLFPEYLEAPKQLGAIDDESLSITALRALAYSETNSPSDELKSQFLELAASALWETAFVQTRASHNSIHTVDQRIELIDGHETLSRAAQRLRDPETEDFHRLGLRSVFTPVMQDVACGNITPETVEEINVLLAEQLDNVRLIKNHREAEGLVGEIKVLQYYWRQYKKVGDLVAVPATLRGGSGYFRPDETHDIDLIKQRRDRSWILAPSVEVKKRKIQTAEMQRYVRSLLAYVAPDGTVSFVTSHRKPTHSNKEIAS